VLTSGKHDLEFRFGTDVGFAHNLASSGTVLFSVDENGDQLREIDPNDPPTFQSNNPIIIAGNANPIQTAHGLATDPTTNTLWAMVTDLNEFSGIGRGLITINPFTGEANASPNSAGENFVSISFDTAGRLWGVTDNFALAAANNNTLWEFDKTTGLPTANCFLVNGNDFPNAQEKAIGFRPGEDDILYHASGLIAPIFEKIDLANSPDIDGKCVEIGIVAPVAVGPANAITFSESEGKFLYVLTGFIFGPGTDVNDLFQVTPAGVFDAAANGKLSHTSKGLAFVEVNGFPRAFDDLVTTDVGEPIVIDVLGNDEDNELDDPPDPLVIANFTATSTQGGAVSSNANGTLTYTPPSTTFSGVDSFTYNVIDTGVDPLAQRFAAPNSSTNATVTVFSIKVPTILSVVANDPAPVIDGYGAGDTITITFSEPVNREAGEVLTQAQLNDTFSWNNPPNLATDYDGVFETPSRLRIDINTPSSTFTPAVGTFTVTVKASENLRNAAGTSEVITDTSDPMTGDFGAIAGPILQSAVFDDPDGTLSTDVAPFITENDTVTIKFDRETNTPGGSGIQNKAAVDSLFAFFENPPFSIGVNYTGQWQTTEKICNHNRRRSSCRSRRLCLPKAECDGSQWNKKYC